MDSNICTQNLITLVIAINTLSLKPTQLDIAQYLHNIDVDLCIVTETWLQNTI